MAANRRTFLKMLAALPVVGAMVPRAKAADPTLFTYDDPGEACDGLRAASRIVPLTAIYADPHYDRIDIPTGRSAVLLESVKTVGVLNCYGSLEALSGQVKIGRLVIGGVAR